MRVSNLSIRTKIYGIVGGALVAGVSLATVLLVWQTRQSAAYESLIHETVDVRRRALVSQLTFKNEVQQWKDVLLRGSDPQALERHVKAFREASVAASAMMDTLRGATVDSTERALAARFLEQHAALKAEYEATLQVFVAGKGLDALAADAMVKGKDKPASWRGT